MEVSPGLLGVASMDIRGIMNENKAEMSLKYCFYCWVYIS
jgi:hypothetical protein